MNRIKFGTKYKGRLVSDIIKIDPDYIKWCIKKKLITLPKHLKL